MIVYYFSIVIYSECNLWYVFLNIITKYFLLETSIILTVNYTKYILRFKTNIM